MKTLNMLCFCVAVFLLTGCATMIHGPLQKFVVTADPKIAAVYVDGRHYGKTPIVIHMTRRKSHLLELKLDGYQTYQLTLKRKFDEWSFANIMTGGIPGLAIDLLTGSIYKLTPKDIYPTLQASRGLVGNESIAVMVTLKPMKEWEKIGTLVPAVN